MAKEIIVETIESYAPDNYFWDMNSNSFKEACSEALSKWETDHKEPILVLAAVVKSSYDVNKLYKMHNGMKFWHLKVFYVKLKNEIT